MVFDPVALCLCSGDYGYEPMERIEGGVRQADKPGSKNRALRQMENEGLCRSEWGRPRAEEWRPSASDALITDEGKRT